MGLSSQLYELTETDCLEEAMRSPKIFRKLFMVSGSYREISELKQSTMIYIFRCGISSRLVF